VIENIVVNHSAGALQLGLAVSGERFRYESFYNLSPDWARVIWHRNPGEFFRAGLLLPRSTLPPGLENFTTFYFYRSHPAITAMVNFGDLQIISQANCRVIPISGDRGD